MSIVGTFLATLKGCPPILSLLAGGASSIGGLATTGGIEAAGVGATSRAGAAAGGGKNPAKACLNLSYIMALMSSINAHLMSFRVQFPQCCCSISFVYSNGVSGASR